MLLPRVLQADDTPKPPGTGVYRVSCATCVPHAIYSPDPQYPEKALKEHPNGTIVVGLVVGADGVQHDIKIVRSLCPELDEAAVEAVRRWKFSPRISDGRLVAARITIEFKP